MAKTSKTKPSSFEKNMPKEFSEAIHSLMNINVNEKIILKEINPPIRISPYSLAIEATIEDESNIDSTLGNFIVIYKPNETNQWGSPFRIVTHITSALENEIAGEQMFRHHIWSKFCQSVIKAPSFNINGTVTTSINEYFDTNDILENAKDSASQTAQDSSFDLRASWSAKSSNMRPHFMAWIESFTNLTNTEMLF
ncbi:MAG: DUF3000 family protein [Bifidobacteriaceae bacterium]|jgi:hypothetical protein|nr:DUF3000 family protein [Bifidobacteriaceae bacterium]